MKALVLALLICFTPQQITKTTKIRLPTTVNSRIGGEDQERYVVHLKKGRRLHVEAYNKTPDAQLYFDVVVAGTEQRFGQDVDDTVWIGVVPKTGDYEIRVAAHPMANYRLRIF